MILHVFFSRSIEYGINVQISIQNVPEIQGVLRRLKFKFKVIDMVMIPMEYYKLLITLYTLCNIYSLYIKKNH